MATFEPRAPVRVGDPAPDFTLPAVEREGTVSLADYREKSPLLLVINRGLWCSFCRRYIVRLGSARERFHRLGIETLAIVAADPERARLYIRHRPAHVPLAADPDMATHRAYGLSMPPLTPEMEQTWKTMRLSPHETAVDPADLSGLTAAVRAEQKDPSAGADQAIPLWDFIAIQRRLYPYEMTGSEQQLWSRNLTLSTGQFLVDRDGVVRWAKVQRTTDPPGGLGNYPSEEELVAAARIVVG